jgi:aryl-alcohol dehydrogenase-like predicted oxidoreductase
VSAQSEYSLLERAVEKELIPSLRATGMSLLPYFPLASGLLTGKYRKGAPMPPGRMNLPYFKDSLSDQRMELVGKLDAFATQHGHTLLELAFSWLLDEPAVASVIAGATTVGQIAANTQAAGWHLTADQRAGVRAILEGK